MDNMESHKYVEWEPDTKNLGTIQKEMEPIYGV